MTYKIFTDAACNEKQKLFSVGYVVRTKRTYVAMEGRAFVGDNIGRAETIAIGVAVDRLIREVDLNKEDSVKIYSDCKSAVNFINKLKSDKFSDISMNDKILKLACEYLKKLDGICTWEISKYKAHKFEANENKIADMLAKYALRSVIK